MEDRSEVLRSYLLHTHARTHTNTQRCQKCTDLLSALSTAKSLSTCNYTSNNGRSIQGLEILPAAHAHTHTHTNTQRCQKCTDLLSALSTAKPLSTCNYTSNNGRWMRGLEILPTAHARTHTHKHTALSEVHRSVVGAEHHQRMHVAGCTGSLSQTSKAQRKNLWS